MFVYISFPILLMHPSIILYPFIHGSPLRQFLCRWTNSISLSFWIRQSKFWKWLVCVACNLDGKDEGHELCKSFLVFSISILAMADRPEWQTSVSHTLADIKKTLPVYYGSLWIIIDVVAFTFSTEDIFFSKQWQACGLAACNCVPVRPPGSQSFEQMKDKPWILCNQWTTSHNHFTCPQWLCR